MILSTYKCDVCGALKKQSNNWWRVFTESSIFFRVEPLHGPGDGGDEFHLCGSACVTAKLNEFMAGCIEAATEARQ